MKMSALALLALIIAAILVGDQVHSIRATGHRRTPWTEVYQWRGMDCWESWTAAFCVEFDDGTQQGEKR